jgi:hypothetical protein
MGVAVGVGMGVDDGVGVAVAVGVGAGAIAIAAAKGAHLVPNRMTRGRVARDFWALVRLNVRETLPERLVVTRAARASLPSERQSPRRRVTRYEVDPRNFLIEMASRSGDPMRRVATP